MASKIYIDQGHNPVNPNAGAEGNGFREQDLVYEIGQRTAAALRKNGFDVRLSRPSPDTQLGTSTASSLAARVSEANAWYANLFLSLHTNASAYASAAGSEAFIYRRETQAARMAADVLEGLHRTTGLPTRGVFPRPGLYVLRKTKMPAALVELGFISNPQEAELMAGRPQLFADGITKGILTFYGMS